MWEMIRIPRLMIGITGVVLMVVFLYLLVAGADESRRKGVSRDEKDKSWC